MVVGLIGRLLVCAGWIGIILGSGGVVMGQSGLDSVDLRAPRLISPLDGQEITDVAAQFFFGTVPGAVGYELQLARDPGFLHPVVYDARQNITYRWPLWERENWQRGKFLPPEPPGPGLWHWRLRAIDRAGATGPWSNVRSFSVNRDYAMADPIRPIDAQQPLFILRVRAVIAPNILAAAIPEDIRPYTAVEIWPSLWSGVEAMQQYIAELDQHGFLVFIHGGRIIMENTLSLSDFEYILRTSPNVLGAKHGEWSYGMAFRPEYWQYFHQIMVLCAKYGRYWVWPDSTMGRHPWLLLATMPETYPTLDAYGRYLVPLHKTTFAHQELTSMSSLFGLWLTEKVGAFGMQSDTFYWGSAGFGGLDQAAGVYGAGDNQKIPPVWDAQMWILGMAMGGAAAATECGAVVSQDGEPLPNLVDYLIPFIRAVIAHDMVPAPADVLAKLQVAVEAEETSTGFSQREQHPYGQFSALMAGAYDVHTELGEIIPNTAQNYFVPLLPANVTDVPPGIEVVPIRELQSVDAVEEYFSRHYEKQYQGDAFVINVGGRIFILSTEENRDQMQSYHLPLGEGFFQAVSGLVGPHMYIMGRLHEPDERLWWQINSDHCQRHTELTVFCQQQPVLRVHPQEALILAEWNHTTKGLHLILSHELGVVEIEVVPAVTVSMQLPGEFRLLLPLPATEVDPLDAQLQWTVSTGADAYRLLVAKTEGCDQMIMDHTVTSNQRIAVGLEHDQEYYWQVQAVHSDPDQRVVTSRNNLDGVGFFRTSPVPTVPETPQIVAINEEFGSVTLTWSSSELAYSYRVYRRSGGDDGFAEISSLGRGAHSFTDVNPALGSVNVHMVVAENELGQSGWSAETDIYVRKLIPLFQNDFAQGLSGDGEMSGPWSAQSGDGVARLAAVFPRAFGHIRADVKSDIYLMQLRFQVVAVGNPAFASFRIVGNESDGSRYQLLYSHRDGQFTLQRRTAQGVQDLGTASITLVEDDWYTLGFAVRSNFLELIVDGVVLLQVAVSESLAQGRAEIYVNNMTVDFDYIHFWGME